METCTKPSPTDQYRLWGTRIRQDDEEAYRELFQESYLQLFKYAGRFIDSRDICKDVLQEVYYRLWQFRKRIDENKSLKAFLYILVRNECMNYINSDQQRYVDSELSENVLVDDYFEMDELNGEEELLQEKIHQWISELPGRQKEAIELSRYEGLDHTEIAKVMNCAPRTINNHIVLALKTLRDKYLRWKQLQT